MFSIYLHLTLYLILFYFYFMLIKTSKFVISNTDASKCSSAHIPEYAFIGRSNVGKSSVINMLTGKKSLAKTSGKPGKTQLINHFIINEFWYLVDLPGYGFANVSKESREKWDKMINNYILSRENLMCLFLLVDSRLAPQKIDTEFMEWLGKNTIPFVIVFTKIDKLSKVRYEKNMEHYKNEMLKSWEELPSLFYTSALTESGKKEILDFIEKTNKIFKK